jgi:peptidoglycan/LPS O-acetylase OafA/YrhL
MASPEFHPESEDWLFLDCLRFASALGIVWHHMHGVYYPEVDRAALFQHTSGLALFVDLFFMISGFIMAELYGNKLRSRADRLIFLKRRVARIFPLHWLVLTLTWGLLVLGVLLGNSRDLYGALGPACFVHNALLLNGFSKCGNGNGITPVTWSLGVEMAMYVLFAASVTLLRTRAKATLFAALGLAVLVWLNLHEGMRITDLPGIVRGLASFAFGVAVQRNKAIFVHKTRFAETGTVAVLAAAIFAMHVDANQLLILAMLMAAFLIAICGDLGKCAGRATRSIAPLGQLTYSIYMWHQLFILVILTILGEKIIGLDWIGLALFSVPCMMMIMIWSFLSWRYFEIPARAIVNSFTWGGFKRVLSKA